MTLIGYQFALKDIAAASSARATTISNCGATFSPDVLFILTDKYNDS